MNKLQPLLTFSRNKCLLPSSLCRQKPIFLASLLNPPKPFNLSNSSLKPSRYFHHNLSSQHNFSVLPSQRFCLFSTSGPNDIAEGEEYETDQNLVIEEWEEDDDTEPEIGDGGAGGGIVLQNVPWGERVLSMAQEVLLQFDDEIKLYSFKTTPSGYVYVRLDQLSNEYVFSALIEFCLSP